MFCLGLVVLPCLQTIQFKIMPFSNRQFLLVFIGYPYPTSLKKDWARTDDADGPPQSFTFLRCHCRVKSMVLKSSKNIYLIDADMQ